MATTQLRSPASTIEATYRNLSTAELYEHAIRNAEGIVSAHGSLVVRTGKHTGRSPQDKFVVRERSSAGKVWWGPVNQPISEEHYDRLRARLMKYIADRPIYSQDLYIGAHPDHRRSLRVTTETAWASIFARNLFRVPPTDDLAGFAPNFRIIDIPSFKADPDTEGTRSATAILVHLKRMEIIIVGTEYAGEIKKSAFTVMNYLLPDEGALPMHSSVNVGRDDDPALFFGLSGTGQDDALRGPGAEPHRRRRAWLGTRWALQLRGRLLRQDDPPLADVRARHLRHHPPLRDDPRERRPRRGDSRARPRLRSLHREHARRLPAGVHRQRGSHRHDDPPEERRLPDGRCVRHPSADQPPHPRAGAVPLHQRLHRQARRDGDRRHRAARHLLRRLRRAVPAPPSR